MSFRFPFLFIIFLLAATLISYCTHAVVLNSITQDYATTSSCLLIPRICLSLEQKQSYIWLCVKSYKEISAVHKDMVFYRKTAKFSVLISHTTF